MHILAVGTDPDTNRTVRTCCHKCWRDDPRTPSSLLFPKSTKKLVWMSEKYIQLCADDSSCTYLQTTCQPSESRPGESESMFQASQRKQPCQPRYAFRISVVNFSRSSAPPVKVCTLIESRIRPSVHDGIHWHPLRDGEDGDTVRLPRWKGNRPHGSLISTTP